MFLIQLIVVLLIIFVGLIFFMRYILTRNISLATGHLQELSKDYSAKQEEANRRLQQVKEESEKLIAAARQEAVDLKEKIVKDAQSNAQKILEEAKLRGKEIADKAQRNYEFLKGEIDQRVEEQSRKKAAEVVRHSLSENILREIHTLMLQESGKGEFQLTRIAIPKGVSSGRVVSAFPLSGQERSDLRERFKKQFGSGFEMEEGVDPALIAGFFIQMGSVVIDASLKNKIQKWVRDAEPSAAS
jgi:vacuolar-type H+-ATPase subunit H